MNKVEKNYIFNIGFSKTGSTSLTKALNMLNIPTLHYRTDENEEIESSIISKNIELKNYLLYPLDQTYQGFSDFHGEHYYKTLYFQYPGSKFIFTTRPFNQWIKSLSKEKNIKYYAGIEISSRNNIYQNSKKIFDYYHNKTEEIREFFNDKPKQFLEMRITEGDGWEELCNFLNVPKLDVPFPVKNIT